jgi:hypothetical protein
MPLAEVLIAVRFDGFLATLGGLYEKRSLSIFTAGMTVQLDHVKEAK